MKKLLLAIIVGISVLSCRTEMDVDPANGPTFMRYFGSEYNHTAVLAMEADNGYTLMSNVEVPTETVNEFKNRIRFIHTDVNGHIVWQASYPEQDDATDKGFKASSFITLSDGYLIIGEHINSGNTSELHVRKIDFSGNSIAEGNFSSSSAKPLKGRAVTVDPLGNFLVLGTISDDATYDMYVSKIMINGASITKEWSREYGSGEGTLLNRLYVNTSQNIFWGGSYLNNDDLDFRLVAAPQNSLTTNVDNFVGDKAANETAIDFCETLGGFAVVGSKTNETTGDEDIYFTKVSYASNEFINARSTEDFSKLNDKGVSICPGQDGGYMILGTVESGASGGNGAEDYYLLKVNDLGGKEWAVNYGNSDKDEGASVRQTVDGSYLVFGTTSFGSQKKLMLMKVGANGKL